MGLENTAKGQLWAIVLAAGEGNRMSQFIRSQYGLSSPKQFVAFIGKRSMLQHTLDRVERLIPPERTLVIVNPDHMAEIKIQLSGRAAETLIFQPYNRDTAPGVLLPLTYIYKKDPDARVAIFPSDHFILEEERFMRHVACADWTIQQHSTQTVLLGVQPDGPEVEYGWIEPTDPIPVASELEIRRVGRFLEKPDPKSALRFYESGFFWNTFVTITRAHALLAMARQRLPEIWHHFERILAAIGSRWELSAIEKEYRMMEKANLSKDVFEKCPHEISVMEVKEVFWSDWGNASRVLAVLNKLGKFPIPNDDWVTAQNRYTMASQNGSLSSIHNGR